jgi:hypothetical protein
MILVRWIRGFYFSRLSRIGVVEWWSGGVVEWWSGGVVEWWSGGVVEWWSVPGLCTLTRMA